MQPRNLRPFPVIQSTGAGNKNITGIPRSGPRLNVLDLLFISTHGSSLGCETTNLNHPFRLFVVPTRVHHFLFQFNVLHAAVLSGNALPVSVNFLRRCIELRPFHIGCKSGLVRMCRNIFIQHIMSIPEHIERQAEKHTACTTRIPVFIPGATNISVLLIDTQVQIRNSLGQSDDGQDS